MFYHFFFIFICIGYVLPCAIVGCDERAPFFDDIIASCEREKYLEQQLPHHSFFKDLDAYITCISDITGLGKVQDGTIACQKKTLKGFTKKVIADQFDARSVCDNLLHQQYGVVGGDKRLFDDTVISILYRVVPNILSMSLAHLKTVCLNHEEQEAIILYARHIRTIINLLDSKQQFSLWKVAIKDNPEMFDEYIALQSIAKRGRAELSKIHEDMHDVLEHSVLIECRMKALVYEVIGASIDRS